MRTQRFGSSVTCAAAIALAMTAGACNRGQESTPAAETQTQSARPANQPMTVTGCLKAGEAEGTYVLAAARTAGSQDSANYQLIGSQVAGLQEHVGQRIEVSGTIEAEQEIATTARPQPAPEKAEGTSGTPTVQTKTEIDVKRLTVTQARPVGEKCDP